MTRCRTFGVRRRRNGGPGPRCATVRLPVVTEVVAATGAGGAIADLVISAADLETLRNALNTALKDLDSVRHTITNMDVDAIGAPPLTSVGTRFIDARGTDVTTMGSGFAELSGMVAKVSGVMAETDRKLGDSARPAG